jgi:hypothetical protein
MGHISGDAFFGLLLIVYGLVSVLFPEVIFFFDEGWKFRYSEPSSLFNLFTRLQGAVAILIGAGILVGWSSSGLGGLRHLLPF